jgi:superfamily II DNA or RNA helicase
MGRAKKPIVSNHDEIKNRFMELFETAEDFQTFFNSILPPNSLLKKILGIEKIQEKEILCDTVLSYLGDNFFVDVGTVRSDDQIKIDDITLNKKQINQYKTWIKNSEKTNNPTEKLTSEQHEIFQKVINRFNNESKINPTHIVREKILQQYCNYSQQEKTETKIIESFNERFKTNLHSLKQLSNSNKFLNGTWAKDLCNKQLRLPDTILEKAETEKPLDETILLTSNSVLPRLYDFQTEALIKIHNMFNGEEDYPGQQKRLLVNLPTGAGKTRMAVQAIIEWLNLYFQGECEHAHEQQKNPNGLIFWFASTNELCTQASGSFKDIFGHIGTADKIHVTNWFGDRRKDLRLIRNDHEGLHIVITNTIHTNQKFENYRGEGTNAFEQFQDSPELEEIRKNTIAIVVDEAHEITNTGYQDFLAAMGFNYSRKKKDEPIRDYNTQNIVLIGLTATPYKGSGIASLWQCVRCKSILKSNSEKIKHETKIGHSPINKFIPNDDDSDFESENFEIPSYVKTLNSGTRKILKTFGYRPFIPIPNKRSIESKPIAIIDAPSSGHVGDRLKISGKNSYDHYSDITYHWEISDFTTNYLKTDEATKIPDFYFTFKNNSKYDISLFVKNEKGEESAKVFAEIEIFPKENSKIKKRGDLDDTKEFYEILTNNHKILSKITHGVIRGPQNDENYKLTKEKRRRYAAGTLSDSSISTDVDYNTKICEIVNKCVNTYKKKHVLIFANSVKHSQELMLILRVKYGHTKTASIDSGTKPGIRRKIVKEFRNGEIPILCNFGILTTGFDVPKIDVVLIARDVGSNALYTQMIGRGQRGPKPGGTDELWLITSYFPHETDDSEDLKLGWEALSTMWQKFPDEIKEDLDLDDKIDDYVEENISKPQMEIEKSDFILSHKPIMDLKLKCQSCGVVSQGFDNCLIAYNYDHAYGENCAHKTQATLHSTIQGMLKENSYHQNCKFCRIVIPKILQTSDCIFTNYVAKNNKLDPIFILIAKFINEYQKNNKFIISFNILKNDIKNYISDSTLSDHFFTHTHPIMEKLAKDKILDITNTLGVKFIQIKDFETLSKIISVLEENDNFKIRLKELIKKYRIDTIEFNPHGYSQLDDAYFKLKKEIGHIPTKRQYLLHLETAPLLKTQFEQSFHGDYLQFLSLKREHIKDDQYLKDSLYDEYFAKCIQEKSRISHDQLDETGVYRLEDYRDMWTTIEKFERKVLPIVDWVLEFYEELSQNSQSELEVIRNDILELKRKIPSNYYHFETIKNNSSINISRYIIQLKISHLKYLKNYHGKFPTLFLQLVSDFFRLKEWINAIPIFEQFIQGTRKSSLSNFMKVYGISNSKLHYSNFLSSVLINNIAPITSEQKQVQQDLIINKLKEFSKQNGDNKTLELINSKFNFENELSVQLKIYFPDTKNIKKIFKSTE